MPILLLDRERCKKTPKNKAISEKLHKIIINILIVLNISILWTGINYRNLGPLKG